MIDTPKSCLCEAGSFPALSILSNIHTQHQNPYISPLSNAMQPDSLHQILLTLGVNYNVHLYADCKY